jgi:hypothetical protein
MPCGEYQLYDIAGRQLKSRNITNGYIPSEFDGVFGKGVYLLKSIDSAKTYKVNAK